MNAASPINREPTGAPKRLGQTHRNTVCASAVGFQRRVFGHGRVPQARAVQVKRPVPRLGDREERAQVIDGHDRTAQEVVRVLHQQQSAGRAKSPGGAQARCHRVKVHAPIRGRDHARLQAGKGRQTRQFPVVAVAVLADEHLLARVPVQVGRNLVGLRPGGHEQRRLAPEHRRDAALECLNGRVVLKHVVADFGARHSLAHRGRRARNRVASKVVHGVDDQGPSRPPFGLPVDGDVVVRPALAVRPGGHDLERVLLSVGHDQPEGVLPCVGGHLAQHLDLHEFGQ